MTMQLFEVNFRPSKRRIRGLHQPDIAYHLAADDAALATGKARRLIAAEHGPGYLHVSTRPIKTEVAA